MALRENRVELVVDEQLFAVTLNARRDRIKHAGIGFPGVHRQLERQGDLAARHETLLRHHTRRTAQVRQIPQPDNDFAAGRQGDAL